MQNNTTRKGIYTGTIILMVSGLLIAISKNHSMQDIHAIEIGLIGGIILYQLIFTIGVGRETLSLKKIFTTMPVTKTLRLKQNPRTIGDISTIWNMAYEQETTDEESDEHYEITLLTPSDNTTTRRITYAINNYLVKNYGAAPNFSIVKDIIDREVNNQDEGISNSISMPLYLGLAATMTGIIFGLFSIDLAGIADTSQEESAAFISNISSLITGVQIAIFASLTGIVFTTVLSIVLYKPAKTKVDRDKNGFISYLQAELLPELQKNDEQSITSLNQSLNHFSRHAVELNQSINHGVKQLTKNIHRETSLIDKINDMDIQQISKYNLQVAKTLTPAIENIDYFTSRMDWLNESLENMQQVSQKLSGFVERTGEIEHIYKDIRQNLSDSRTIMEFLNQHLDKIKHSGNAAEEAVNYAESTFREAISNLREHMNQVISTLQEKTTSDESVMREAFGEINQNLNQLTNKYIEEFEKSFSGAVPRFEKLDHLGELVSINSEITEHIRNPSNGEMKAIIKELRNISQKLHNSDSGSCNPPGRMEEFFRRANPFMQIAAYMSFIVAAVSVVVYLFG